jgi:hypothetical protein
MKILKHKALIPITFALIGLFYLFEPFLSAWFEVVNPFIARNVFLPMDWIIFTISFLAHSLPNDLEQWLPDILFGVATIFYLAFFTKITQTDWPNKQIRFAFLPLVVFPLIWLLMSPLGLSFFGEKRMNSYVIGGWSRMMFAGGPDIIKKMVLIC